MSNIFFIIKVTNLQRAILMSSALTMAPLETWLV
jgi:hypothetical protein